MGSFREVGPGGPAAITDAPWRVLFVMSAMACRAVGQRDNFDVDRIVLCLAGRLILSASTRLAAAVAVLLDFYQPDSCFFGRRRPRRGILDAGTGSFALRPYPHFRHVLAYSSSFGSVPQYGAFPLRCTFWVHQRRCTWAAIRGLLF